MNKQNIRIQQELKKPVPSTIKRFFFITSERISLLKVIENEG